GFILIQLVWRLADNAVPAFNELHARGDHGAIAANLLRVGRYTLVLALGVGTGILLFNRTVVTLWVGDAQYAGTLMTASLAAFAVLAIVNHLLASLLVVYGRVMWLSIASFAFGTVNVASSFVLGRRYGVGGVMLASALAEVVGTLLFLPQVTRLTGLRAADVHRAVLRPALLAYAAVTPVLVAAALRAGRGAPPLADLALAAAYALLWCAGVWYLGMSPPERREARDMLLRARSRVRSVTSEG
ncbi:MAG: lipopolysaccharide biosynthesis protein, partial [Gemmatimonadaceae bacterium]